MARSTKTAKTPKEYENLGRALVNIYESNYLDQNQALKNSFIKGMVSGIGGVIGATIVIAAIVWLLSLFRQVPLIGHFVETFRQTIQNR